MARMPQIPEPKIDELPSNARDREATEPSIGEAEAPFKSGAEAFSNLGGQLQDLQNQRDEAADKLQKIHDETSAADITNKYEAAGRDLWEQVKKQNPDAPDKWVDLYQTQLASQHDTQVQNLANDDVALLAQKGFATKDGELIAAAQHQAYGGIAVKAKNDFTELQQGLVSRVQSAGTLEVFNARMADAVKTLAPLSKNLRGDPDADMDKFKHDAAVAWIEAQGPKNPVGVGAIIDKVPGLKGEERDKYSKDAAENWLNHYAEVSHFQIIKDAVSSNNKIAALAQSGDFDSKHVFPLREELEQKQEALQADPNLKAHPAQLAAQLKTIQMQMDGLKYLAESYNKGNRFDSTFDSTLTNDLHQQLFDLGKPASKGPKDLQNILKLQTDIAKADFDRKIAPGDASTMQKALSQMTGKGLAQEAKNTGWDVPFLSHAFQSGRQTGNEWLNSQFKNKNGLYGEIKPKQQNAARLAFLQQLNDVGESNPNVPVNSNDALQMAQLALDYATGKVRTPK